jgi:hypothetical protein
MLNCGIVDGFFAIFAQNLKTKADEDLQKLFLCLVDHRGARHVQLRLQSQMAGPSR